MIIKYTCGGEAISSCSSRFLVEAFHAFGEVEVNDEADVLEGMLIGKLIFFLVDILTNIKL